MCYLQKSCAQNIVYKFYLNCIRKVGHVYRQTDIWTTFVHIKNIPRIILAIQALEKKKDKWNAKRVTHI